MSEAPKRIWACAGCGCAPPFDCDCATSVAVSSDPRETKWKREVLLDLGFPDPDATILAPEHARLMAEKDARITAAVKAARLAALEEAEIAIVSYAKGEILLGGQRYRTVQLEVAVDAIRALKATT